MRGSLEHALRGRQLGPHTWQALRGDWLGFRAWTKGRNGAVGEKCALPINCRLSRAVFKACAPCMSVVE